MTVDDADADWGPAVTRFAAANNLQLPPTPSAEQRREWDDAHDRADAEAERIYSAARTT